MWFTVKIYFVKKKNCLDNHNYYTTYIFIEIYLTFVPTSKKYNKKQLDTDAKILFHLIKFRVHVKYINTKLNADQGILPFQIKIKQSGHQRTPIKT